jgi:hypothetical protein
MSMKTAKPTAALVAAGGALAAAAQDVAPGRPPEDLIAQLRSTNEIASASACDHAPDYGASAVRPLGFMMADKDFEVARRAKRALQKIVRHAGRPGADAEAAAVATKLMGLLTKPPTHVRRDVLWMLSEIGASRQVEPIAALLKDKELREDARCVLTRMPCPEALAALKSAFPDAEEEFKYALADALRARGEKVDGYPTRKMVPTARTTVVPLQPKK